MLGLALVAAVAFQESMPTKMIDLSRDQEGVVTARVGVVVDPFDPPRTSPKSFGTPPQPWLFPWLTSGWVFTGREGTLSLRFRVYSQERKAANDDAEMVTRMLTALWKQNRDRLLRDHSQRYNGGLVDVFLCWGGKAGGEQRFDIAYEGSISRPVNSIYFYDLKSFTDPVERAREVAHEYGHATLPPIGGFEAPESWANGYLGEKLFMKWMADIQSKGKYTAEDAMGASAAQIQEWVTKNVDPLVVRGSQGLPTAQFQSLKTEEGMNRYIALAVYAEAILPEKVFARSINLTGSLSAKDYPEAIALAAEEPKELTLRIPTYLRGKSIWIPNNKGLVSGATVQRLVGNWAKVTPTAETVVVTKRK